jgi:inner membrane protein involved in colicin E2 resistance
MRFPLLGRTAVIAGVAVMILLPPLLVNGKIAGGRPARRRWNGFAAEPSGPQRIVGPPIALACQERSACSRSR